MEQSTSVGMCDPVPKSTSVFDSVPQSDEELNEKSDEELSEKSDEELNENSDEELREKSDEELNENSDEELREKSDEELNENSDDELREKSDKELNDSCGTLYTDAKPAAEDGEKFEERADMVSENYVLTWEGANEDLQSASYETKTETILRHAAADEDFDELRILRQAADCADTAAVIHLQDGLQGEEAQVDVVEKVTGRKDEEELKILIQAAASAGESRQSYSQGSACQNNVEVNSIRQTTLVNGEETDSKEGERGEKEKCAEEEMQVECLKDAEPDEEDETERPRLARSQEEDEKEKIQRQLSPSLKERGRGVHEQVVCTEDEEDRDVTHDQQCSVDSSEGYDSLGSEMESDQDLEEEEPEEEDSTEKAVLLGTDFYLSQDLLQKLFAHQKDGVLWLWGLHKKSKTDEQPLGGILGDDMGLGKTVQIIAFLSSLFLMKEITCALIVVPVTVMVNWQKEFRRWAPTITVASFHGAQRQRTLDSVQKIGGVLLTTYGTVVKSWQQLSHKDEEEFVWDYVILDEGHKIKNPTKTTKGINSVGAKHRVIMTGTPIQNNLKELWTLFDYTHQSTLFGSLRSFKSEYENPIVRSRERDASQRERRQGIEKANRLKKIIDPYFLRRTKADVAGNDKGCDGESNQVDTHTARMPEMTYKNDLVIWLYLSDNQVKIYRDFLELDEVQELLMTTHSPLVALNVLKKICDHPRLLSVKACHQLGLHGYTLDPQELAAPSAKESAVSKLEELSDDILVEEAGKMGVLISLLDKLRQDKHRCLIFSQSRKMLDIIQKILKNRGHKIMRLDGKITQTAERDRRVQEFQQDESYSVFLLTTQVGGVGLTLTSADRVIIYDPSWNPATDAQAVDRAFRIGQTRNVVVYRLITCGTVEEKIYRRQIFKDSITRQTTGNAKDPYRYFTKQELFELFSLGDPRSSSTQQQLQEMHGMDRRRDPELDQHIAFLGTLPIFGISDHDLMFSQEIPLEEEEEDFENDDLLANPSSYDAIQKRLDAFREQLERESKSPEQSPRTSYLAYGTREYGSDLDPLAGKQVLPYTEDEVVDLTTDDEVIDLTRDDCLAEVKVNHWSGCHWKKRNLAEYIESSSQFLDSAAQSSVFQRWPSAAPLQLNPIDWQPYLSPTFSVVQDQKDKSGDSPIKTIFEEGENEGPVPWDRMIKSVIERPGQTCGVNRSPEDHVKKDEDYFVHFIRELEELSQTLPQTGHHDPFQTSNQRVLNIGQSFQQNPAQPSAWPDRPEDKREFESPPGPSSGQTLLPPVNQNLRFRKPRETNGFLEDPGAYNSGFESWKSQLPDNPNGSLLKSEQRQELESFRSSARHSSFLQTEQMRFNLENPDGKTLDTWQNQAFVKPDKEQDREASWHDHAAFDIPERHLSIENEETRDRFQNPGQHLSFESAQQHLVYEKLSQDSPESLDHDSSEDSRQTEDFLNTPDQCSVSESEKSEHFFDNPNHDFVLENSKIQNILQNPTQDPILDNEQSRYVFKNVGQNCISECGKTWDVFDKPDQHSTLKNVRSRGVFKSSNQQSFSKSEQSQVIFESPDEQSVLENGQSQDIFEYQDEQSVLQSIPYQDIGENAGPRTVPEETQDVLEDSDYHSVYDRRQRQGLFENPDQPSILRTRQRQGTSKNKVSHVDVLADPAQSPVISEPLSQLVTCEQASPNPRKRLASSAGTDELSEKKAVSVSKHKRVSFSADSGLFQSSEDSFLSSEEAPEAEWTNRSVPCYQSQISVV